MADFTKLLKVLSEDILKHNQLAKLQAKGVLEAGVGDLKSGALRPIRTIRSSQIEPEFYWPEKYSNEAIAEFQKSSRVIPTGLEPGAYSNELRITDSPFGKVVTPMGEHQNADPYLVRSKSADDKAILYEYLKMMSEFE